MLVNIDDFDWVVEKNSPSVNSKVYLICSLTIALLDYIKTQKMVQLIYSLSNKIWSSKIGSHED